ncbi:MAG TPA: assimilatory sulfite reductase (NADPH) flavoprotein subunit [Chthoniobacteraceae bacterium]|nr:assimilatory sulfite reductase (NADPH) flavoprotein subunit [Chthoniobacteraceae bacterium]
MLPEHSPFIPAQRRSLEELLATFSPAQRFWLAGYLSATPVGGAAAQAGPAPAGPKLTVLYGSESGNAEKLAGLAAKDAKKRGFKSSVVNMADITPTELAKVENLLVIVSTWGEGDPPETAAAFHKQLMTEALELPKLRYSVCALGDTSYTNFCQTGKEVDARLETFGAERLTPRQDCDVDYDDDYKKWIDAALEAFGPVETAPVNGSNGNANGNAVLSFATLPQAPEYSRKNPFQSELLERVLLNGTGTAKETWHYELSLENSGLDYEPGDALGVLTINPDDVIEPVLKAARLSGTEAVEVAGVKKSLTEALREDYDITVLSRPFLTKLQGLVQSPKLAELLSAGCEDQLRDYLWGRWIVDALEDFPPKTLTAAELTGILRKQPPRLYSIASSLLAHPDEVHLTIASVRYRTHGRDRKGIASTWFADALKKGDPVPVYLHKNKNFRLPASGDTPIIMVGPGTGVAPFRSFVEHRAELGHKGKSWLLFGDQRYSYDFLYQLEWQQHLADKALSRLDVAFSRDQPEKIYVQDKMREQGRDLYAWLEEGAHFYVCGDASRMAHDVHDALLSIVEKEGGKSREAAESYLEDLKKAKRYQRDVY